MSPRIDEQVWRDFVAWCRARRLRPLPAHPWTLAAYARWCQARHRSAGIAQRIRAIARKHVLSCLPAPDRHPIVVRTLRLIERHEGVRAHRAALFPEAGLRGAPEAPRTHVRDAGRSRRRALATSPRLVSRRPAPG